VGGLGSGERWSKKDLVESHFSIDTTSLKRWNLLGPGITDRVGSFEWRRGDEEKLPSSVSYWLKVGPSSSTLRLMYSIKSQNADLDYAIQLVTTPCHLGGARWWFICPLSRNGVACGRRVRKLYLSGKYFGCRLCQNLTYRSTQESDSRVYAAVRGGLHLSLFQRADRMSIAQLGFALRVLMFEQRRLDRLGG